MFDTIKGFFKTKQQPEDLSKVKDIKRLPEQDEPEVVKIGDNRLTMGLDYDYMSSVKTVRDMIAVYRNISIDFEIDDAVQEITNESIVIDETEDVLKLNLDDTDLSKGIKNKIFDEFDNIVSMLDFNNKGDEIFKQWYIDGRLYYQKVVNPNKTKEGIKELRKLDPLSIKRVKKVDEKTKKEEIYYVVKKKNAKVAYKVWNENITFVPSGLIEPIKNYYVSYLHKSIKPLNQLHLLEDSAIIYRITRAPERRVFYVDVGRLPKTKAEDYIKNLINKFKNKIVYDSSTGEISQKKNVMTMIEDFWLPRTEAGKGTQVETLAGGTQLGEMTDIEYFKNKLYKSLSVPPSRFDTQNETGISFNNMGEITREELRFSKFCNKLRHKFVFLFMDFLKTQLLLKNIINLKDWEAIKTKIKWVWNKDNYYEQIKMQEVIAKRLETLSAMDEYVGKYYSQRYVKKEILFQTDDEIKQIEKEIEQEAKEAEEAGEEPDEPGAEDEGLPRPGDEAEAPAPDEPED
jgi:hypothetical protein